MNEAERMLNYQAEYYLRQPRMENWYWPRGLIRPDQLAVIGYLYGVWVWGSETEPMRDPHRVLSMGCGRGVLEKKLEDMGLHVIGVDPAPGAQELYLGSNMIDVATKETVQWCDSLVYCESIEHMPKDLTRQIFAWLTPGTFVVIANWVDHHPLPTDDSGWDHITLVDDAYYDELSAGHRVVLRRGSHMVLEVQ